MWRRSRAHPSAIRRLPLTARHVTLIPRASVPDPTAPPHRPPCDADPARIRPRSDGSLSPPAMWRRSYRSRAHRSPIRRLPLTARHVAPIPRASVPDPTAPSHRPPCGPAGGARDGQRVHRPPTAEDALSTANAVRGEGIYQVPEPIA
eukprot:816877-Prorocentrum_minimum.AAC.1